MSLTLRSLIPKVRANISTRCFAGFNTSNCAYDSSNNYGIVGTSCGRICSSIIQKNQFMSTKASVEEDINQLEDDIPFPLPTEDENKPEGFDLIAHSPPRGKLPRGALIGSVVSTKMQKTVNVAVDRYRIVPKYRKRLKYTRKFMAHDEVEECNEGDVVMIIPCQKRSKLKHFEVAQIMRKKGVL